MPTIQIITSDVRQKGNAISFVATQGNKVISRTVRTSTFDTWEDFAKWLINQEPDFVRLPDKEKTLEITFHTETVTDPEFGDSEVRVLDSVSVL